MKKLFSVLLALVLVVVLGFVVLSLFFGKVTYTRGKPVFSDSHFSKNYYKTDRLLLVNVWATWCAPCVAEFPVLEKFSRKKRKLTFISVSMDEDTIRLKNYIDKHPYIKPCDITLENLAYRDLIYEKIELGDPLSAGGILKIDSKQIPYLALVKGKKILYKSHELDTIALQKAIDQNSD
jgi:thiol-disulfide isomerase/thioredoxin